MHSLFLETVFDLIFRRLGVLTHLLVEADPEWRPEILVGRPPSLFCVWKNRPLLRNEKVFVRQSTLE